MIRAAMCWLFGCRKITPDKELSAWLDWIESRGMPHTARLLKSWAGQHYCPASESDVQEFARRMTTGD